MIFANSLDPVQAPFCRASSGSKLFYTDVIPERIFVVSADENKIMKTKLLSMLRVKLGRHLYIAAPLEKGNKQIFLKGG